MSDKNVGFVVTWQCRGAFVSRKALQQAIDSEGIKYKVKRVRLSTYLRRAVEEAAEDNLIRKIGEDGNKVSFAVVDEDMDFDKANWRGNTQEAVTMFKATKTFTFTKGTKLGKKIEEAMTKHEGGLLSREISRVFYDVVTKSCGAVSLRPGGGVLFVPSTHADALERIERAIRSIKAAQGFNSYRFSVARTTRSLDDLYSAFKSALETELDAMYEEASTKKVTKTIHRNRGRELLRMAGRVRSMGKLLDRDMSPLRRRVEKYQAFLVKKYEEEGHE